jgi:exonuclease SbcC
MIPVKLSIAGFLSYQEPVEIDFTAVDLVCITGENGAGKSSILDAITWALFGRARKHDESIINLNSNQAEVRLDFDYEGNRYRINRINPRGETKLVDFYLQNTSGDWVQLTERTIRETDQKIIETLRLDYDTFINASFFLQGEADQFTQQTPSARKRILSQILGLEVWETYRKRAVEKRREFETSLHTLEGRLEEISRELSLEDERRQTLKSLEVKLAEAAEKRAAQEQIVSELQGVESSLEQQNKLVENITQQLENKKQSISNLEEQLEDRKRDLLSHQELLERQSEIEEAYQNWEEAQQALSQWEATAEKFREQEQRRQDPLLKIAQEKARLEQILQNLLSKQSELEKQVSTLPELEIELKQIQQEAQQADEDLKTRDQAKEELEEARQHQANARAENPRLYQEMQELKSRIRELESTEGAHCPLCGQELTPEERSALISSLESEGKELGDQYRSNKTVLDEAEKVVKNLQLKITELSQSERILRDLNRSIDRTSSRISSINNARTAWQDGPAADLKKTKKQLENDQYAEKARQELNKINAELKNIGYDAAAHDRVRKTVQEGKSIQDKLRQLDISKTRVESVEREISGIIKRVEQEQKELKTLEKSLGDSQKILEDARKKAPDIKQAKTEFRSLKEEENILQRELGAAEQKVSVLETQRKKQEELITEQEKIRSEIKNYLQLEEALGKNGVPALLIEQSLPQIETHANRILDKLSSGKMSIRFLTQKSYQDTRRSDKKETLEIQIKDQSGVRDYEMYSGGESFRINFSVRLALSHLLAQRAGARLQTLVIDEGFGSQDTIGRQRLIEAINLIKDDYQKILVITHVEEIQDMFSDRLLVEKTPNGSRVQLL